MRVKLPKLVVREARTPLGLIVHLGDAARSWEVQPTAYAKGNAQGVVFQGSGAGAPLLVLSRGKTPPQDYEYVLKFPGLTVAPGQTDLDLSTSVWLKHPRLNSGSAVMADAVLASWKAGSSFERIAEKLREPQLGALHALHSYWSAPEGSAVVVLPTGTGKTETMIAAMLTASHTKLLVVVPTDALRTQLGNKFDSLGILSGVMSEGAHFPIVGFLTKRPKTVAEATAFFGQCNVVVTTMTILGQSEGEVQKAAGDLFSHLFIDEAHHAEAPTWRAFRESFPSEKVVQFTATPFRNDEKPISGKIIYNYPLRLAQEKGYFKPIKFRHVLEFNPRKRDEAIAQVAIAQLQEDLAAKLDHVLMARVSSISRVDEVLAIYSKYPQFNPVAVHSGISAATREKIKGDLMKGSSRVVVCVDMLGEGFDMPTLKIAAFHDVRKSLPVTLQLIGRFTRSGNSLGDATAVANIAETDLKEELRSLYQSDVDWNSLLPLYANKAIKEEFELYEFLKGFKKFPEQIALQNIFPKMSTVAYKTRCKEWTPASFRDGLRGAETLDRIYSDHNAKQDVLVVVTTKKIPLDWAKINEIYTWDWQLYVLFWDREQQLLFINNSSNDGFFEDLAKSVAGQDVDLIKGAAVFRCFGGVNLLKLQNVGLIEHLAKYVRFTMRSGSDVAEALSDADKKKVIKSNLFGSGYEAGARATVGCSVKGRLWSMRVTNIKALTDWCRSLGKKLLDTTIDPEGVLMGTLVPKEIHHRPPVFPVSVDWNEDLYRQEKTLRILADGDARYMHETTICLKEASDSGPLKASVVTDLGSTELTLDLYNHGGRADFKFSANKEIFFEYGKSKYSAEEFFAEFPPTFWFADGSSLSGNEYLEGRMPEAPYDRKKITALDWAGTDIRVESQGADKKPHSIQRKVIEDLLKKDYDVVFDDDGPGEMADIVAVKQTESSINVEFYHCKFSSDATPGARIADMYEVCGQAQTSVRRMEDPEGIFHHLLRRRIRNTKEGEISRLEKGTDDLLLALREKSRKVKVDLKIVVVQPGVSKKAISDRQVELLAVAEHYTFSTFLVPLVALVSP